MVISECEERTNAGKIRFKCRCDCGNIVNVIGSKLVNGWTKSCSCEQKKITSQISKIRNRTNNGFSNHNLYPVYHSMIARCHNIKSDAYYRYGGRGIMVCDRWRGKRGFYNFLNDMGERPSREYSIDRKDNNKGYCPENCRWATKIEQENNKSTNRLIQYKNENYTIAELARLLNLKYLYLYRKLKRNNYNYDEKFNIRN